MSFSVIPLGSSAAVPMHGRHLSAHFVQFEQTAILIDCGEGTQHQLLRFRLPLMKLSTICITHLHGDHVLGVPGLLSTMALWDRTQPLTLIAPEGIAKWLDAFLDMSEVKFPYDLAIKPLNNDAPLVVWENQHAQVTAFPLDHRVPTWGFQLAEQHRFRTLIPEKLPKDLSHVEYPKLKAGNDVTHNGHVIRSDEVTLPPPIPKRYTYCSDTAFHEHLYEQLAPTDLLYHEATFEASETEKATQTGHSTTHQAAKAAHLLQTKKLLIGHYSNRYPNVLQLEREAREVFEQTEKVEEGKKYIV